MEIHYLNRKTGKLEVEQIYGEWAIRFLYDSSMGKPLMHLISRHPLFSKLIGWWQRRFWTKKKISPFITQYKIDTSEFAKPVEAFSSFDDFFTRRLKPEARPIAPGSLNAIIPADGRYRFYPNIAEADGFLVKGKKFELDELLQSHELAAHYAQGSMCIARLCPTDYHRYFFPCDGTPGVTQLINGCLYSVNPIALRQNIKIFSENKRTLCRIVTQHFGTLLYMEIGATAVGSIHQTYHPHKPILKGMEKGYFSFGGSSLILLFEPKTIHFDCDLIAAAAQKLEVRCLMGESMGKAWDQGFTSPSQIREK